MAMLAVSMVLLLSAPATVDATQRLVVPTELPCRFDVVVRLDETFHTLQLTRYSLRASGFTARTWPTDQGAAEDAPSPPATYRGSVAGVAGAIVTADLNERGLHARVVFDDGKSWIVDTLPGERRASGIATHAVRSTAEALPWPGDEQLDSTGVERPPPGPESTLGGADFQRLTEVAIDADFTFYEANGSSVPATIAAAEALLNEVDLFSARDVLISYTLTHVIVRTAPFYSGEGDGLLDQLMDEWNTNQTGVQRDVAHLLWDAGGVSGFGTVGAVCDLQQAYAHSSGPAVVLAHELGHNWGVPDHCHDHRATPCAPPACA